jgi:hypothetical protein
MKKSLIKLAGALLLAFAVSSVAHANPINGSISFSNNSGLTTDSGNLLTATKITGITGVTVSTGSTAPTGTYAGTDGDAVTFITPIDFSGSAITPFSLWTFTAGGTTYSFTATSVGVVTQLATFLNIGGSGIAYVTGYTPTAGVWSLTSTSTNSVALTFSASTTVPDGGTTALLVGLSLLGLSVAARRRKSA